MARSPRSNRTDRLTPEAPTAAPNQTYGEAGQQIAAQRAIPISGAPTVAPQAPSAPASSGPPTAPQGAPGSSDLMSIAQAHNGPGNSLALNRPTERPNEPVTHGLPVGPGGGPEALQGVGAAARDGAVQQGTLANLLQNMITQPNVPAAIQDLASRAMSGAQ